MGVDPWQMSMADPFTPGHLDKIASSMQSSRPRPGPSTATRAKQPNWIDQLYEQYRTQQQRDWDFQMNRYNEGRKLLGLDGGDGAMGFAGPAAGGAAVGSATGGASGAGGPNQWGGGGPAYSPQAAKVNQDAMRRGIFNTQHALNTQTVSNDLALSDASYRANQQQFQQQQAAADRNYQLMQDRLRWLEAPSTVGPDPEMLVRLASMFGQGTTDGLDPAAFSGGGAGAGGAPIWGAGMVGGTGYGGAVQDGYGVPMNMGFSTPPSAYRRPAARQPQFDPVAAGQNPMLYDENGVRGGTAPLVMGPTTPLAPAGTQMPIRVGLMTKGGKTMAWGRT